MGRRIERCGYTHAELETMLRVERMTVGRNIIAVKRQLNHLSKELEGLEARMAEINEAETILENG